MAIRWPTSWFMDANTQHTHLYSIDFSACPIISQYSSFAKELVSQSWSLLEVRKRHVLHQRRMVHDQIVPLLAVNATIALCVCFFKGLVSTSIALWVYFFIHCKCNNVCHPQNLSPMLLLDYKNHKGHKIGWKDWQNYTYVHTKRNGNSTLSNISSMTSSVKSIFDSLSNASSICFTCHSIVFLSVYL